MLHVFSARFLCRRCGEVAATVYLVPPAMAIPGATESSGGESWRLAIDGGPIPMTVYPMADPSRLAAILDRGDLAALAAVDEEYANFRCPECRAAYCRNHWSDVKAQFDEGFYDVTSATCPEGHRIVIDD
jgi:predicted RNA-binding Zn-ribbon protein involved in translation (DUF1610 family)